MPQICFKGVKLDDVIAIRKDLVDELTEIIKCPRDYFTVEQQQTIFVSDKGVSDGYPFVDVYWFDRGQDVQNITAQTITKFVHKQGYPDVDIVFHKLIKDSYYENGTHF